jgi:hypothetical protein
LGEGIPDGVGVAGECADGDVPVAAGQAVELAVAVGEEVALGGGDADAGDPGGLFAGVPEVDGPEDEHLAADDRIGVVVAVGEDAVLFVGGEGGSKPGGHP